MTASLITYSYGVSYRYATLHMLEVISEVIAACNANLRPVLPGCTKWSVENGVDNHHRMRAPSALLSHRIHPVGGCIIGRYPREIIMLELLSCNP